AEQTGWTSVRMLRTTALWNKGFSPQRHARDVDLMHVEVGVEQRAVNKLTLTGSFPVQQGETNCHRRGNARRHIADCNWQLRWTATGLPDLVGNPGIGRGDVIIAWLLAERATLPGEGNRAHDESGIELAQLLVA